MIHLVLSSSISATWDHLSKLLLVDSGLTFSVHKASNGDTITHLPYEPESEGYAKRMLFAECGEAIVTGGEHGQVYVFRRNGGNPVDVLRHASCDSTAALAVRVILSNVNKHLSLARCTLMSIPRLLLLPHAPTTFKVRHSPSGQGTFQVRRGTILCRRMSLSKRLCQ